MGSISHSSEWRTRPALAAADYGVPFEHLDLPAAIKDAIIVYQGQFTPDYAFMQAFLN